MCWLDFQESIRGHRRAFLSPKLYSSVRYRVPHIDPVLLFSFFSSVHAHCPSCWLFTLRQSLCLLCSRSSLSVPFLSFRLLSNCLIRCYCMHGILPAEPHLRLCQNMQFGVQCFDFTLWLFDSLLSYMSERLDFNHWLRRTRVPF